MKSGVLDTLDDKQMLISILRFGTIKFYDAHKNFGYIIDQLNASDEYYFSMPLHERTDVSSLLSRAGTIVQFNLKQVRRPNGRIVYNAVNVAVASRITAMEMNTLEAIVTANCSPDVLRKFKYYDLSRAIRILERGLSQRIRRIGSAENYSQIVVLVKYYKENLLIMSKCRDLSYQAVEEKVSQICLGAPVEYQSRLWLEGWISIVLADSVIFTYIERGLDIEKCLKRVDKEQAERIYRRYIQENVADLSDVQLLNIWCRNFPGGADDVIKQLLLSRINIAYTDDQIYQLIQKETSGSLFWKVLPKSYFLDRQFGLSELGWILRHVEFVKEEKLELICKADGSLQEKINCLERWEMYDEANLRQLLCKLSVSTDQVWQLALDNGSLFWKILPASYFDNRQFGLSELEQILRHVEFEKENKIELICSADCTVRDKVACLKHYEVYDVAILDKLSVPFEERWQLWESGVIGNPFTHEELYGVVTSSSDVISKLKFLDGVIPTSEYVNICGRYCQDYACRTTEDLEWRYNLVYGERHGELSNEIAERMHSYAIIALRMEQWVQSDSCQGYEHDFGRFFSLLTVPNQAVFLRKIIELHRTKQLQLTTNYLLQLIKDKSNIGINVLIVVRTLCKLRHKQEFLSTKELYEIVHDLFPNSSSLKLLSENKDLFDCCRGRITNRFDYMVYMMKLQKKQAVECFLANFDIQIDMDHKTSRIILPIDPEERNKNIRQKKILPLWMRVQKLKERISPIRYNPADQTWQAPAEAFEAVKKFAVRYNDNAIIRLSKDGRIYNFFNMEQVNYCPTFHEGVPWMRSKYEWVHVYEEFFGRCVYWCMGQHCFNECLRATPDGKYQHYTLYDFIRILNLTTATDVKRDLIKFYSVLNWFNDAMPHFYCDQCQHMLEPSAVQESYNAHYLTRFRCGNENCPEHFNVHDIYINHCFNPSCRNVIDDRRAKRCPNGMVICTECGVCCCQKMYENKRMISPNVRPKQGHLEREWFYCPYCGAKLIKDTDGEFVCAHHPNHKIKSSDVLRMQKALCQDDISRDGVRGVVQRQQKTLRRDNVMGVAQRQGQVLYLDDEE